MDQNQNKQKSLIQFIKSQFLKKDVVKLIILSVSAIFSLFFSHSTLLSLLNYFNFYYYSTLPFKLFSHTLDKNCIFLICNGLLAFLANYSALFTSSSSPSSSSSSSHNYNLNDPKKYGDDDSQPNMAIMETEHHHQQPIKLLEQEAELENAQMQPIQIDMQYENGYINSEAVKAEDENSVEENLEEEEERERAVLEEDKDKDKAESEAEAESRFLIEEIGDEEEEEEGGGNGKLSNEELNKKFDDFIRKMKEELRFEARQQLIMV